MIIYYCATCGVLFVGESLARMAYERMGGAGEIFCPACGHGVGGVDDDGKFKPCNCVEIEVITR